MCVSILTVREFNVLPGDAVRVLLLESPTASVARLGCTTFQYNNPNDNTDEYPSGYSKYISKSQLSHLHILGLFMISAMSSNNINILNTDNCTLNIHTLETRPHSRGDYLSLVKIQVKYDPEAKCTLLLEFFNQVLRPEDIPVVIQMIGYCLYKTWIYQKSFMLFGRTGSNGKGVLLNIIEALIGKFNCSHRSLQDLDPTDLP